MNISLYVHIDIICQIIEYFNLVLVGYVSYVLDGVRSQLSTLVATCVFFRASTNIIAVHDFEPTSTHGWLCGDLTHVHSIFMYMHMYMVHVYVYLYNITYIYIYIYIYISTSLLVFTCIHIYKHVHVYYMNMHICIYIYICTCLYKHILLLPLLLLVPIVTLCEVWLCGLCVLSLQVHRRTASCRDCTWAAFTRDCWGS